MALRPARRTTLFLTLSLALTTLAFTPSASADVILCNDGAVVGIDAGDVTVIKYNSSHTDGTFSEFNTLAEGRTSGGLREGDEVKVLFTLSHEGPNWECARITFASYTRAPGAFNWKLYDEYTDLYALDGGEWMTLRIEMPECNFAVWLALGEPIEDITPAVQYFDDTIDGVSDVGDGACENDEIPFFPAGIALALGAVAMVGAAVLVARRK